MEKKEGKSFSELIHWLTDKNRKELMEFAGTWKDLDVFEDFITKISEYK